jgi:hypothetical protein
MTFNKIDILIDKETIEMQCKNLEDIYIYMDFNRSKVELYCNDEEKLKLNFIKIAKKYGIVSSEKEFWKRIRDIGIKKGKDLNKDKYVLTYEWREL